MKNCVGVAVAVATGFILAKGCSFSDKGDAVVKTESDLENRIISNNAQTSVIREQKEDAANLQKFLKRAKEIDPNVVDAYYANDDSGNRVIKVAVLNPQYAGMPASEYSTKSDAFGTFVSSAVGSVAGNMLAEAIFNRRDRDNSRGYVTHASGGNIADGYCNKAVVGDPDCHQSRAHSGYNPSSVVYSSRNAYKNERSVDVKKYRSASVKRAYLGETARFSNNSSYRTRVKSIANKSYLSTSKKAFTSSSRFSSRSSAYSGGRGFGG
ncbi:hypothetical protein [Photobacterium kishitanii]|uniref:DUF1190 domain-containing protein n=1 Tax=Photobacterium kishitanii TaxID=318456 RepID=A0A2T3KM84_9GAMM|nr:hypothetical protein [Photobacterium kishitanii]PSV00917.1 hypothetical protein C9J27_02500 [Photobacterium kishitanii]